MTMESMKTRKKLCLIYNASLTNNTFNLLFLNCYTFILIVIALEIKRFQIILVFDIFLLLDN